MTNTNALAMLQFVLTIVILFSSGCSQQEAPGPDDNSTEVMEADPKSPRDIEQDPSKRFRWTIGTAGDSQGMLGIKFRGSDATTEVNDAVALPPMIQGAPGAISVDAEGNQYVGGEFEGAKDFNPRAGVDGRRAIAKKDAFVSRFNSDGTYQWTQTFGGMRGAGVRQLAVAHDIVYASIDEQGGGDEQADGGRITIVAMDSRTGKRLRTFGKEGVQTFSCAYSDWTTGIVIVGRTVYVAVSCYNVVGLAADGVPTSECFAVVLALDAETGRPRSEFGDRGVQTFGNAGSTQPPLVRASGRSDVSFQLSAASASSIYLTGWMDGRGARGIGGKGTIERFDSSRGFVIALDAKTGQPKKGFGTDGVQILPPFVGVAGAAALAEDSLYIAGSRKRTSDLFVAALDAGTGSPKNEFGDGGFFPFSPAGLDQWEGCSEILLSESGVYVVGGTSKGAFLAAFDKRTGEPCGWFGMKGVQLIEGLNCGAVSASSYQDFIYLAATTMLYDSRLVTIADKQFDGGDWTGFLFKLGQAGALMDKDGNDSR